MKAGLHKTIHQPGTGVILTVAVCFLFLPPTLSAQNSTVGLAFRMPSVITPRGDIFLYPFGASSSRAQPLFPQYADSARTELTSSFLDEAVQFKITYMPGYRRSGFMPSSKPQELTIAEKTWISAGIAYKSTAMALIAMQGYKSGNKPAAVGGIIGTLYGVCSEYQWFKRIGIFKHMGIRAK